MDKRPMETAPLDGTEVLLFRGKKFAAGYYEPGSVVFGIPAHWRNTCRDKLSFAPTHWMPRPDLPTE